MEVYIFSVVSLQKEGEPFFWNGVGEEEGVSVSKVTIFNAFYHRL
jgi:hypothetical protein